jgi:hypothetical protein
MELLLKLYCPLFSFPVSQNIFLGALFSNTFGLLYFLNEVKKILNFLKKKEWIHLHHIRNVSANIFSYSSFFMTYLSLNIKI